MANPVSGSAVARQVMLSTVGVPKANALARQVMLQQQTTVANSSAVARQVMTTANVVIPVTNFHAEVIGRGYLPEMITRVSMEIISGLQYSVPATKVTLEVIAATTQTPPKPMQRIIWFHGA